MRKLAGLLLLGLTAVMLAACDEKVKPPLAVGDEHPLVQQLATIVSGDPEQNALEQVKQGNYRLWGYSSRADIILPGVPANQSENYAVSLGVQLAPAMGDVLYSDEHKTLREKFIAYAALYNQTVIANR